MKLKLFYSNLEFLRVYKTESHFTYKSKLILIIM